ncbi:MAG: hypothetical protein QNJ09_15710, partial [Paracoccaceae bacterium]|nr:hypothetical protein [Paracoccaceae bacterium]
VDLAEALLSDLVRAEQRMTVEEVTTYLQIHRAMIAAAYFEGKHLILLLHPPIGVSEKTDWSSWRHGDIIRRNS